MVYTIILRLVRKGYQVLSEKNCQSCEKERAYFFIKTHSACEKSVPPLRRLFVAEL
jgi:hypothetical protein